MSTSSVTQTEILNPRLRSDKEALAREFQKVAPFPHVAISDFFTPEFSQQLVQDFPAFEERFAKGQLGQVEKKAARKDVRNISDAYREVDDFIQTPDFLNLMSEITGIPDLLYDPEYHGGGTHENLHGQGLFTHIDFNYHPRGWHRRLNLIVYLTPGWKEEWGGSLELHSNPWDPSTDTVSKVVTEFNRAVLFETSEHSWHGFLPVKLPEDQRHLSRRSFAIYLYTMDRPAEQTAADHSTIYVPFGMPEDLEPGAVLSQEHHEMLNRRFNTFRTMLKYQYDRQQWLSEQLGAIRLDLQGYAVQTRAPAGRGADGWVLKDFSLEFTATRPVKDLLLDVWVPPELESDQPLEIRAGDWSGTEVVPAGEVRTLSIPISIDAGETVEVAIHAGATWTPGGGDTRELAYRIVNAVLEH